MKVERIAVSLEPELLKKFEGKIKQRAYWNRSKAVSDVLREWISRDAWEVGKGEMVATISILYNHHMHDALDRITDLQHEFGKGVLASMHIHLSHDDCLEVIAVKGSSQKIRKISDGLSSVRGVKHCKLAVIR
jgi:CopG family transcriptional regulator, nickel-responsive regulator